MNPPLEKLKSQVKTRVFCTAAVQQDLQIIGAGQPAEFGQWSEPMSVSVAG